MIRIATIHFQTERWMSIQLGYLKKHLKEEFTVYACTPSPAEKYSELYYFCSDFEPRPTVLDRLLGGTSGGQIVYSTKALSRFLIHAPFKAVVVARKLDYLARQILRDAEDDELIVFLDGDAFPIADCVQFIRDNINSHKLVAIRRDENDGDIQPHPSFCATTVGFWKEIKGDWNPGYAWKNRRGQIVTDLGGSLLRKLHDAKCDWYPLLRSNRRNLHPLWFGIYGDIIYHHGAGFREPISRLDLNTAGLPLTDHWAEYKAAPEYQATVHLMEDMFEKIKTDESFYLELK